MVQDSLLISYTGMIITDMTTLPTGIVENTTNKTCEQLSLTNNDYLKILWTSAAELPGKHASH